MPPRWNPLGAERLWFCRAGHWALVRKRKPASKQCTRNCSDLDPDLTKAAIGRHCAVHPGKSEC